MKVVPIPVIDKLEFMTDPNPLSDIYLLEDYVSVINFLRQYGGNISTFESYRREVEKIIQWAWRVKKISLLKISRSDIEEYIKFCINPPISWIATKRHPRFIDKSGTRCPNKDWRPFVSCISKLDYKEGKIPDRNDYSISQKTIREIFSVLSSMFNFFCIEGKVERNPVALIKQKNKYLQKVQKKSCSLRLTEKQWDACVKVASSMATKDSRHERTLFIISSLYLLYLRISELTATERWVPEMNNFYQDANGCWWFKVVGKGNKMREIAVSDAMLNALKRYRKSLGLTDIPSPDDDFPLIPKERGKGPTTSTRRIRQIVQLCFDEAIHILKKQGQTQESQMLESATVHWLRHTGISDDINKRGRPIAHVRDDAGHSSSAITDQYNDIDLMERYKSAKSKSV
ncbi:MULTISPECIES: tyrosine-type recombinase/integrase [Candidatus Ichthyocystis]|uniref:Phage integrase, XerC family n=1 Tax=Candidatus Ichthyocystis hellenicum TaxID=1561003 RepID=A0A0S4M747_9BURK|nr:MULTISPECIES: site-specific integrase [Ichthyocystis]CUT17976.1 Phage integrase, XerC family [Candidatus Ichthyocystis hellenicum]